jgi:pimeloyl-ACP methyl ester carboxylesterase
MTVPALPVVLVHGGAFHASCWRPTVDTLERRGLPHLAVDLPGHGRAPGDLSALTVADAVGGVVDTIDAAGHTEIVLVGHSLAGVTLPGVITALGAGRVRHAIYIACHVPAHGTSVVDTLREPLRTVARRRARSSLTRGGTMAPPPHRVAVWSFTNGMTRAQRSATVASMQAESPRLITEPADRTGMPAVPTTWVLTTADRSLSPTMQRRFVENLGGVDDVVEMDAGHMVMISHPDEVAEILETRARAGFG